MTTARKDQVDATVSRWYHCISRCVRRAHLLGEGEQVGARKKWIETRLQMLDAIFAVSVGGYSVMDNHLHVLLRLDPDLAAAWTEEEVLDRWFQLYPPRGTDRKVLPPEKLKELREERLKDKPWLATARERLGSLSWFMKSLKEPLSRMVNREERCTGAFFEGRFKSIAILDEEALLSVAAYIDLNPVAAGIAKTPEESEHTSVKSRVDSVRAQGRAEALRAAKEGSVAASKAAKKLESKCWLIPIEDRRRQGEEREGMLKGFTLGNYLLLVEHTGRLFRRGKASISSEVAEILDRIGSSAEAWEARMQQLRSGRLLGRFIASSREKLREAARKLGISRAANLSAKLA